VTGRTEDGFDVFFGAIGTTFCLKGGTCAQGKGQGLVILCEEVVDFAGKEGGGVAGLFGEVVVLVQRLAGEAVRRMN
jgi:hypothetical protein